MSLQMSNVESSLYRKDDPLGKKPSFRRLFTKVLAFIFILFMISDYFFLQIEKTSKGLWQFQFKEDIGIGFYLFSDLLMLGGSISFLVFLILGIKERFALERRLNSELNWDDFFIYLAWLLIPYIAWSIIPPELDILFFASWIVIAFVLKWKQMQQIGFQRPRSWPLLIAVSLFILFFIMPAFSILIDEMTTHIFHVDSYSEREEGITDYLQSGSEMIESSDENMTKSDDFTTDQPNENLEQILVGILFLFLSIVDVCLIAPIAEEILFRGYLQTILSKKIGVISSVIVTAIIFSAYHVDPAFFGQLLVMGLLFGIVREAFKSIWASIILHILANTLSSIGDFI